MKGKDSFDILYRNSTKQDRKRFSVHDREKLAEYICQNIRFDKNHTLLIPKILDLSKNRRFV